MLLVLCAPSVNDPYYKRYFGKMIDFYVVYVNAIKGHDEVIVLVDKGTMPLLEERLPRYTLLLVDGDPMDPWIRDVSPVNPSKNILFRFSGGLKKKEAKRFQGLFTSFLKKYELEFTSVDLVNDGGNFVYDADNKLLITTDKFMKLNKINENEAKRLLKETFDLEHVLILPSDDDKLGHVDGMCSLTNNDTLVIADYSEDEKFEKVVQKRIQNFILSFDNTDLNIVRIRCPFNNKTAPGGFASAFGAYMNCVPTEHYIYVPIFNHPLDEPALQLFQKYAGPKKIIPVDVTSVCDLGGSLRCLSWEVTGNNADKLLNALK